jgi:two-component system chemotaxis family response regulator WspR
MRLGDKAQIRLDASCNTVRVLLVDDQPLVGEMVRRALLPEADIEFHYCLDAELAAEVARNYRPTVILQDLIMPGISGLDLLRQYRNGQQTAAVPVVMLSSREDASVKSEAFGLGANDYLVKLPDPVELLARIRYHSAAYVGHIQRDEAYRALRESQRQLLETNLELERLNNVDGLTGLSNRKHLDSYLESEWRRCARAHTPLSLLMVDVDHFKLYNDTCGHVAGDEVLRRVARALRDSCRRPADLSARYGGEEFAVVLPDVGAAELPPFGEALRRAVSDLDVSHPASATARQVTVSIGGATAIPDPWTKTTDLVSAADRALYEAKRDGRNRVVSS